jgi:metal-responsive CopG/Arc/MetJ family transcriptional regulator
MVGTTDTDRTEKLGITLPISLLKQIENKRGDIPRSTFIRRAIENYLKGSIRSKSNTGDDGSCSIFLKSTNHKKPMKSMSH